ncbi:MAG: TrmH family RNA methyltransferase [Planctomycetota bacterium]
MAETRCPNPRCRTVFAVEERQFGRNVRCPACGQVLTARPRAIWEALDRREAQIRAGELADAALDEPRGFQAREAFRRQWLYHPMPVPVPVPVPDEGTGELGAGGEKAGADPVGAAAQLHDPLYEPAADRSEAPIEPPADLIAVVDDLRSQWNVGSIFRTAEGAGWAGLRLCGITPTPPAKGLCKTALGAEQHLPWRYHAQVVEALEQCRAEGRTLVALEQTADAVDLNLYRPGRKLALLVGNEVVGVSAEALALCSDRVRIPMAGRKASLNVAVAFGLAAFTLAGAWRSAHR